MTVNMLICALTLVLSFMVATGTHMLALGMVWVVALLCLYKIWSKR